MKNGVQRREVREAILDATDRLLARYGYKKMTIDDLAADVGIGKGSIYLHFSSKEEIALSHIDRIIERMKRQLNAIAAEKETSIEEKLRRMILTRVLFRFDSVQHYTQSLNDLLAALRAKLLARREVYFQEEAGIIGALIEEGQRQGIFEKVDPTKTAEMFLLATNSLLPYSLSVKELGERSEIEEKTLRLADLLLRGIKRF
ncbi:MAG: TetR/AcrR family transcriptional regulator [Pyrinomonadaceae bacterium]